MIQDSGAPKKDQGRSRKQIRKKIIELLRGNTEVGQKVFDSPSTKMWDENLPRINVYAQSEDISEFGEAPREYRRDLSITIEIVARGPETSPEGVDPDRSVADILDDIAEEVEQILQRDETLGCVADETLLDNAEFEYEGNGAVPIASLRLSATVSYNTMAQRQAPNYPDLKTAQNNWNVGENENTREAVDEVDLQ